MLQKEYYNDYCKRFSLVWNYLRSNTKVDTVSEICEIRHYDEDSMVKILKGIGFAKIENPDYMERFKLKEFSDLGLFSKKGDFLLVNRYIFPVKDMLGNVIALIGWLNDDKRYITTPSALFSKGGMFFGMEQLKQTGIGQNYVLVEGIFDSLSVRSLGLSCISMMGINTSKYKQVLYGLFKKIIAIPDGDGEGRKVIEQDRWKLNEGSKYLKWKNVSGIEGLKDIDDLCKLMDNNDLKNLLNSLWDERKKIITIMV